MSRDTANWDNQQMFFRVYFLFSSIDVRPSLMPDRSGLHWISLPLKDSVLLFVFLHFSVSLYSSTWLWNGFTIGWEPCPVIPYLSCFYSRSVSVLISRKGYICIRLDEMVQYGPQNTEARQYLTKSVGSHFVFGGCLHFVVRSCLILNVDFSRSPWLWY